MRVYLAGQYQLRHALRGVAAKLREEGLEVTARWINREEEDDFELDTEAQRFAAREDLEDLDHADAVLLVNDPPSQRGGAHFETGYALARGKAVILVGRPTVIFHQLLPSCRDLDQAVVYLKALERARRELEPRRDVRGEVESVLGWPLGQRP